MGHPSNPISLRLGNLRGWESNWIADKKTFGQNLYEDNQIRTRLLTFFPKEIIAKIIIERALKSIKITIHTSKPGILIGSGGAKLTEITKKLKKIVNKDIKINVSEVRRPELDATLVAASIGQQLKARVFYRRAIKQAISTTIGVGAKGIKVYISGRIEGADMGRREKYKEGRVPAQTLRADIDYACVETKTPYGMIGIKVWIFKKYVYGKRDLSLNLEVRTKQNRESRYSQARKKQR